MTVIETLKAARAMISNPKNWTQGEYARDADGEVAGYLNKDAVSFSAMGAILTFREPEVLSGTARSALGKMTREVFGQGIDNYNDTHTHAEVLAAFDATIARLETSCELRT